MDRKKRDQMREAAERAREQRRQRESGESEAAPADPAPAPELPPELARFASDIADVSRPSTLEVEDTNEAECPACAETIKARAKVCKHCGHELGKPVRGKRPRASLAVELYKPFLAGILSVWCPGFGHFYCGDTSKGMALFFAAVIVVVAAAFFPPIGLAQLALVIYAWSDATGVAKRKNVAAGQLASRR